MSHVSNVRHILELTDKMLVKFDKSVFLTWIEETQKPDVIEKHKAMPYHDLVVAYHEYRVVNAPEKTQRSNSLYWLRDLWRDNLTVIQSQALFDKAE